MTRKLAQKLVTLIAKAQTGDRLAYSQIVRQFQNLAVGYAYSILRNMSLAEEAAQEAFIEAYLNLHHLRKPSAFPGWLKKIVFKQCDRLTRKKRHLLVSLDRSEDIVSSAFSPDRVIEQRELQQTVRQAIEQLSKPEREVISLFYLGDRSQKEIAAWLEISVSTVKNRLFSARKKLKTNLTPMIEDYLSNQRPSKDKIFAERVERTIEAVCNGDEITIQNLLQQDAHLANAKSKHIQTTPLTNAAHRGYLNIVKLLVLKGANVNEREGNYSQSTALHWAATGGHLDVVKYLVGRGAKLNLRDKWHNLTPLGWATILQYQNSSCASGSKHQVREFLLSQGAELNIFSAISLGDLKQVKSLVAADREILQQKLGFASQNMQPLHYAIKLHQNEIVKFIIQQGAELQARTRWGITPLCLAREKNNWEVIRLLRDRHVPEDLGALLVARQWKQAESMIEDRPDLINREALLIHYLIRCDLLEATAWLIDRHADLEIRTKYKLDDYVANLTPLHGAIANNRVAMPSASFAIAKLLTEKGAQINSRTTGELEITALHGAAALGNLEMIRLLVKHQADLNATDNLGIGTPLDFAKDSEQLAAVELLTELSEVG